MIRPLDNERCNRGIAFKRNKIMKKQINNLMIALAFILTIGCLVGCVKQEREKSRQAQTVTSSTTKEDKEAIKQKQLAYLKEHEKEIVDFVKSKNSKIASIQVNWSDIRWGEAGNGTPQGGGEIIELYGGFNHIENSGWNVTIEIHNEMPDLKTMMLSNGFGVGGEVFE